MSILEVHNVSIRYMTGDFKNIGLKEYVMRKLKNNYHASEFWADQDITFSLEKEEMLGIIGGNGAGKSTLLKVVSGIMEPTKGKVIRRGKIAALLNLGSGFDGDLTVKENVYLRGAMLGYTRKFMDETYDQIIEFAELEEFQDRLFRQLSSGMRARLAFSIASFVQPDILILDEVLSVGDGAFRKKSAAKMREVIGRGATTILVSHSLGMVRELCNKVLWIERGRQIAFGDTEIICSFYQQYLDKKITLEHAKEELGRLTCHYDYLIVGAGLFGCTFAREAADRGKKCLVIDGRQQLGGNLYCENVDGITVHKYGTHIFHTDDEEIWDYINRYAKFVTVDGGFVPVGGYNGLIEGLLKGIPAVTGLGYRHLIKVYPDIADKIIYTGGIDDFFEYSLGHLEYDSLKIELKTLNQEYFQDKAVVIPEENDAYHKGCTRIIEYKHFLREKSKATVVAWEYPQKWIPGRLSCKPVGGEKNEKLLAQYQDLARGYPNVIFGGRLGSYKGYTMSEAIAAALKLAVKEMDQPKT